MRRAKPMEHAASPANANPALPDWHTVGWQTLGSAHYALGESPFWHAQEQRLYWVDIPGKQLLRAQFAHGTPTQVQAWDMPSEPGCIAPAVGGGVGACAAPRRIPRPHLGRPAGAHRHTALRHGQRARQRRQMRCTGSVSGWAPSTSLRPATPPSCFDRLPRGRCLGAAPGRRRAHGQRAGLEPGQPHPVLGRHAQPCGARLGLRARCQHLRGPPHPPSLRPQTGGLDLCVPVATGAALTVRRWMCAATTG